MDPAGQVVPTEALPYDGPRLARPARELATPPMRMQVMGPPSRSRTRPRGRAPLPLPPSIRSPARAGPAPPRRGRSALSCRFYQRLSSRRAGHRPQPSEWRRSTFPRTGQSAGLPALGPCDEIPFTVLPGGFETMPRRHAPPALVPVLKIHAFELMTRLSFIALPPAVSEPAAIHPNAKRIGETVEPFRSPARPKATTAPAKGPGHKVGPILRAQRARRMGNLDPSPTKV